VPRRVDEVVGVSVGIHIWVWCVGFLLPRSVLHLLGHHLF